MLKAKTTLLTICSLLHIPAHHCTIIPQLPVTMVTVKTTIVNLPQAIAKAQKISKTKVVFPQQIPYDAKIKKYYAYTSHTEAPLSNNYMINIDSTKKCHGAHYCNIGFLQTEQRANPQIYYDRNHKEITTPVMLALQAKGYFTPSHAMGDFWPAMLAWRYKHTLYTLSWRLEKKLERTALIKMANSVILQLQAKPKHVTSQ